MCDSGKKVGLGLGNLPAQDVQPVKTCHDAYGIDLSITGELCYFLQLSCLLLRLRKLRVAAVLPKSVNNWYCCVHSVKLVNL